MNASDLGHVLDRRLSVLGSTGSVGTSTLSVVEHARKIFGPDAFPIEALTAQSNAKKLAEQARQFRPRAVVIGDNTSYSALREELSGTPIEVHCGDAAVIEAAFRPADAVMIAIVGAAALAPALAAVRRGALVALANKECIVAAGEIFREALQSSRATVIPVDSEHNAAFQLLDFAQVHAIDRLTLTASGGPFRRWSQERMAKATPEEAVAHPNWSMGAKISIDSATLMNKGLELIEAHHLFGLSPDRLGVIVHPQSIVHCLISYADGSTLAHMSAPDMQTPIAYALSWPKRIASPSRRLDLATSTGLTFEQADEERFPCLRLAQNCLRTGGAAPTILNAANEIAVRAFLDRRIGFLDIARTVELTLSAKQNSWNGETRSLDAVIELDRQARETAADTITRLAA